jgi:peptidoglycan/xylan/chitin deacetylase (PgdA/CDA1 family)
VLTTSPEQVTAPAGASSAGSTRECSAPLYGVNYYAPGTGKTVALTFDDGPGPTTMPILSILQTARVTATFFNLGLNSAVRPREVRAEATVGAALGNHTWDHPQLPTLSSSAQAAEMDRASAEQVTLVGRPPCLFRPPYGAYTSTTLALAQQRRMAVWNWSVDTEDWKAGSSTSASWVERIISRAEAGGSQQHPVVLMHNFPAGLPATLAALPTIIAYYRARGYTFIDLFGGAGYGTPGPAVATTAGGVHVVVRGSNGGLDERTRSGGSWSGWSALGGVLIGGPAAAAAGGTTTAVFVEGADNRVWEKTITDAGGVSAWAELGGSATSKPAAVVAPSGVLSVVIRGADAGGWLRENTGGRWGAWQPLGGVLATAPAAAVTVDGGLTVAAVGTDKALWVRHRTGMTWSAWRRVGGAVSADPALSTTVGGGRLVAVVRGADRGGWVNVADASATSWSGWRRIGGVLASTPAVAVDGATLRVVAYGTDGRVWEDVAGTGSTAAGWSGWHPLPG